MNSNTLEYQLVQRIREAAPNEASEAFAQIYDLHAARVYSYVRRMLSSAESGVQDLVQQVFVNFYEQLRGGTSIENVRAYLLRSARNLCFNELARQKPSEQFIEELYAGAPTRAYEQQELIGLVYEAIEKLPDDYKEIVLLREQLGLSFEEIADIVGIRAENARARASRAMKMIRSLLADYIRDLDQ